MFEESVNGIVIGPMSRPYEFWTTHGHGYPLEDRGPWRLGRDSFENDEQARQYAKDRWPEEYRRSIEMRCFD